MKPLLPIFTIQRLAGRVLVIAPDDHSAPAGRTFERRELHADDCPALTVVADEASIAPKLPPPRRAVPRRSAGHRRDI